MRVDSRRIVEHLQSKRADMTVLLEALVRLESPSKDPATHEAVLTALREAFERRQFRARVVPGESSGGVLLALPRKRTRGRPHQLLLGHADTVWPVGTLESMPVRTEEGKFWGPGSYDMKAGLVQGLFALDALRSAGASPTDLPVTPVFVINSDEEIGSRDSTKIIRRLARGADRCFVLEPALGPDGALKTARKGIGRFTITIKGKAAHAGLDPGKGVSAILELSHIIQKLFALNDLDRGVTVNVGTIDGGLSANVVAPESRAVVDVRVPTRADAERVETMIRALETETPGTAIEIVGGMGRPPMERTPGNQKLWLLALRSADELGFELDQAAAGGGSDGNTTSQFAPTLDGLGAVGAGAHAANEHLVLDKMVERAALLARLLSHPPLEEVA